MPRSSKDAVEGFEAVVFDSFGDRHDWLYRPMLVGVREFLQNRENVAVGAALAVYVGLVAPDDCPVCSADAG